ncbi:aminodeoxychorismate/anthranilate synthase component II [Mycobacterium sp. CVI_P3]|uniref:Aminodeoxychorismate/anthranilate synthase component II n=1 Tax=Mycobacterium pinniadriaticum TaxID=2994102 RepID=A0ABT3S860_9MYCO|nr:aminodeoxychorismate/anthranilate synthase component II [Mycobacterium pinniadriaticum]MCX2929247.1 aminodeoxychorismate/anthranilate synthase component II [Mycobacterium pinniadriaticum]MCX2935672.1 aminodeoxychorismate/anthranilate synthase component II [Mycobacterium pinniadriaticum]
MQVLVVDNYDSFVFNLVQYLGQLGVDAQVWRNDDARLGGEAEINTVAAEFDGVLLSPGPGTPERAGASIPLVGACAAAATPLLGVCLGHQAIGVAFGGTVDRAPELLHGKTSTVYHTNSGVLHGLPNPFTATRYHSLTILPETVPAELEVTGRTKSGVIMAVRHVELPIHGVQFHPESILTEGGHRMLANWLGDCGQAPEEALVRRLEQEVADTVRHALGGGRERSDREVSELSATTQS